MPTTLIITEAAMRRTAAARDPITSSDFRRRAQIPRTPDVEPWDAIAARLGARFLEAEKTQKIKRLKQQLIDWFIN